MTNWFKNKYLLKLILLYTLFLNFLGLVYGQDLDYLNPKDFSSHFDLSYGEYERNKFDILLPKNDAKHGLIIYIHGGGFQHGDKKNIYRRKQDIKYFLDNNIAVVSINYRFYTPNDSLGVRICLEDIQTAIQYLRFHADEFNIDKERVGCYGNSAGAGSSLYFAFHDNLAIKGDTSLKGESTRLKCAGAIATQATYNVFKWKKIIPYMRLVLPLKRKQIYNAAANFYGYSDYKSFKNEIRIASKQLDMLSMIDAKDPPIYLMNLMKEHFPKNDNVIQHHRNHAIVVSKKLNKHNVKNHLYTSKIVDNEKDIDFKIREFIVENLK
ncbi:alpha/beta hydrolase family protein [Seonamhaeicola aphaedonensis]|uniref:Carboxylesterase family protein n=1 Tax=Seonamhaeicola aphaedonensis TaxID=1461338 RepID=A0A3D9HMK3_9FLAO|nr:alpha/beta hydrolase [Seonamhaeicola aphaedonensis]RED50551.1 carboxylesterase family protein [Seonamhaeicola aphaedonensis]